MRMGSRARAPCVGCSLVSGGDVLVWGCYLFPCKLLPPQPELTPCFPSFLSSTGTPVSSSARPRGLLPQKLMKCGARCLGRTLGPGQPTDPGALCPGPSPISRIEHRPGSPQGLSGAPTRSPMSGEADTCLSTCFNPLGEVCSPVQGASSALCWPAGCPMSSAWVAARLGKDPAAHCLAAPWALLGTGHGGRFGGSPWQSGAFLAGHRGDAVLCWLPQTLGWTSLPMFHSSSHCPGGLPLPGEPSL